MTTIRLNNHIRERIATAALRHRFSKEVEALRKEWAEFAIKVYNEQYDQKTRTMMESLPDGWLPENSSIRASFGGQRGYFYFNGSSAFGSDIGSMAEIPAAISKRFLWSDRNGLGLGRNYPADAKISEEFTVLSRKTQDLNSRFREAKLALESALNSVWTVGAVLRDWPHLKPFIPVPEKKASLPAVTESRLNELLDLPVS